MKSRIEKIMLENSMSASQFADKIGVPRSGLSHVLKGRNKPSLDYVLKVLNAFPQIDSNWLLTGADSDNNTIDDKEIEENNKETAVEDINIKSTMSSISTINKRISENKGSIIKEIMPKESKESSSIINDEDAAPYYTKSHKINSNNKEIAKIVFFYKDGSFEVFN